MHSTDPFNLGRRSRWFVCKSSHYHHQIGNINQLLPYFHSFPWLCLGSLYHHCLIYIYMYIWKSKDYVYGIWVYKALGIWKGYYRVQKSLVSYVKPWTEAGNNKYMKYHSKLTYQLSFWNVSRKVDYQVVHPRPQTPQGESVAKPETPLLIILSIACKWGPWQHVQSVIQKAKSVDKNILGRWLKVETASQT